MGVQPMLDGDEQVELDGFLTDELGRRARGFVGRHADEPFLLTLAFNAVHNFCWQLPADELIRRGLPGTEDWRGVPAGNRCPRTVRSLDIVPTALSAAGAPQLAADLDGIDLLPTLRGRRPPHQPNPVLGLWLPVVRPIGRWKLAHVVAKSTGAEGIRGVEHAEPGSGT